MPLILGADASNVARPILVDSSGRVLISQLTPANLLVGDHGYDGAAWRKQGLVWAYLSRYAEVVSNLNAAAGENNLMGSAVPAGEVWVVTVASVVDITSAPTRLDLVAIVGGAAPRLVIDAAPVVNRPLAWTGQVILAQGDYVQAVLSGCTAGDDLYLHVAGYKMGIAM